MRSIGRSFQPLAKIRPGGCAMKRRALIVGAATGELAGVSNDVETMSRLLAERDFEVRRCVGAEATRTGILGAYEALISDTGTGDGTLVYYSGHGGRARPVVTAQPASSDARQPDLQFIVPTDFDQSSPTDFR